MTRANGALSGPYEFEQGVAEVVRDPDVTRIVLTGDLDMSAVARVRAVVESECEHIPERSSSISPQSSSSTRTGFGSFGHPSGIGRQTAARSSFSHPRRPSGGHSRSPDSTISSATRRPS